MADTNSHTAPDARTDGRGSSSRFEGSQIRPREPMVFGKYELLARVRTGGMAEVFKARAADDPDAEVVALKRILPSFTDEADYVAMFIDEAKLAQRLEHPAIVSAHEMGTVDDSDYIAFDYVAGQDLAALLRRARERSEPLPLELALHIAIEVCDALHYAHTLTDDEGQPLSIVHRDVSPPNILVSYQGAVKLIDFGIAKSNEQLMRTQAGFLKGKHGYLSPEQALGEEVGQQSDLFSLGVCLYEMLSAERLFRGASDFSTLTLVRRAQVPSLAERNPKLPEAAVAVVHQALARRPRDRFASALELKQALEQVVQAQGLSAGAAELSAFVQEKFADAYRRELAGEHVEAETTTEESTGLLDAFDDVDPVSTVSALSELPEDDNALAAALDAFGEPELQSAPPDGTEPLESAAGEGADADPHAVVGDEEVEPVAAPASQASATLPGVGAGLPSLGIDWDEEELSTQIYDSPEDLLRGASKTQQPAATPVLRDLAPFRDPPPPSPPAAAPVGEPVVEPPVAPPAAATPTLVAAAPAPSRAAPLWTAVALLALVAAGALALTWMRSTEAGTIHITTSPADAVVTLDGQRVASNTSPFVITEVAPGESHELVVAYPGHRAWRTSLTLRAGQQVKLPHVTLAPDEPAVAEEAAPAPSAVSPEPEPEPATQGRQRAPGPRAVAPRKNPRAPGPRGIVGNQRQGQGSRNAAQPAEATQQGAEPQPEQTPAEPSESASQEAGAEGGKGVLRINSRPWSQVFVDGRLIGNTPQMALTLSAGRHNITLVNPEFDLKKVLTVDIESGQTLTRIVSLE